MASLSSGDAAEVEAIWGCGVATRRNPASRHQQQPDALEVAYKSATAQLLWRLGNWTSAVCPAGNAVRLSHTNLVLHYHIRKLTHKHKSLAIASRLSTSRQETHDATRCDPMRLKTYSLYVKGIITRGCGAEASVAPVPEG